VGAALSFLTPFVTLSFLITTPDAWVSALGDAQHGFPYLSGGGRLVLKDIMLLAGGLLIMADSARASLRRALTPNFSNVGQQDLHCPGRVSAAAPNETRLMEESHGKTAQSLNVPSWLLAFAALRAHLRATGGWLTPREAFAEARGLVSLIKTAPQPLRSRPTSCGTTSACWKAPAGTLRSLPALTAKSHRRGHWRVRPK